MHAPQPQLSRSRRVSARDTTRHGVTAAVTARDGSDGPASQLQSRSSHGPVKAQVSPESCVGLRLSDSAGVSRRSRAVAAAAAQGRSASLMISQSQNLSGSQSMGHGIMASRSAGSKAQARVERSTSTVEGWKFP